jgi:hypothetical protein
MVAEELECDWNKVTTEYPTPGENIARDKIWGSFSTCAPQIFKQHTGAGHIHDVVHQGSGGS